MTAAFAIVVPCGPGAASLLDTLESVEHYCAEEHDLVVVDDATSDGTYEALIASRHSAHVLRNPQPRGIGDGLIRSLADAYRFVLEQTTARLILRLDQDALLIGPDVLTDASEFAAEHPDVGLFGVYDHDFNRPRSFSAHAELIDRRTRGFGRLVGGKPWWEPVLVAAEQQGYRRGDNVFGGAYFITRDCLASIERIGGLDVPDKARTRLQEDVYYSMATVAAGYRLGHFAAPEGPLCLEWQGLPYPAEELSRREYKIVHSVDKGPNTGPENNDGRTAREVFRGIRLRELSAAPNQDTDRV